VLVQCNCCFNFGSETADVVETATEVKEPPPPDVAELCRATFQKTADFLQGELAGIFSYENFTENFHQKMQQKQDPVSNINHISISSKSDSRVQTCSLLYVFFLYYLAFFG